jgi:uncharacterized protein
MDDSEIKRTLEWVHTIATVGFSASPEKPSHRVPVYLLEHGYAVIPINPTAREIAGQMAFPSLLDAPAGIDLVQIFRPAADVPPIVDQAIAIGARIVWMQEGIANAEAAAKAEQAGLTVIMDRCMKKEYQRLIALEPPDDD